MKVNFKTSDLKSILKISSVTLASSDPVFPIAAHFLFRKDGDGVEVLSYKGKVFSSNPVLATDVSFVDGVRAFSVEGKRLKKALDSIMEDEVEFDSNGTVVVLTVGEDKISFPCLDVSDFPYWDDHQREAKESVSLTCGRLRSILSFIKTFISRDEESQPSFCLAEYVEGGKLYGMDNAIVGRVHSPDLASCHARFEIAAIAPMVSFLASHNLESRVSIKESETAIFLETEEGSMFGQSLSKHRFPELDSFDDRIKGDFSFSVSKKVFLSKVNLVSSASSWEDERIYLHWYKEKDLKVSADSVSGDKASSDVPVTDSSSYEAFKSGGYDLEFSLNLGLLTKVLSQHEDDDVTFEVNLNTKTMYGWIVFRQKRDLDRFVSVVPMMKD